MKDIGKRFSEQIIEHITEMIVILDTQGIITYANHHFFHLLHTSFEDIIGKNFFDFIDSSDLLGVKKEFVTLIKNPESSIVISYRLLASSGKKLFVSSTFNNLIDDQYIQGIFLSLIDITDTKRIEQQLLEVQRELKDSINNTNFISDNTLDVIFQVKLTGEYTYMNPASKRIAGYDPDEMIGRKWMEFVPKKELIRYLSKVKKLLTGEQIDDFQTFVIHKDGHLVPVEFSGKVVKKGKKTYINGVMRDLSNRIESKHQLEDLAKSLEEQVQERKEELESTYKKLREKEEMYETLFMELPDGATLSDEKLEDILEINKKMASNLGYAPKDLKGKKWKELLPESIYQERIKYAKKAFETNTVQSNFDTRGDFFFHSFYVPLILPNGKKLIYGIARDITERKKQEILIRESEKNYRMLFENANEAIAVAQDGYLRLVNPKFKDMIGLSYEQIYRTPFVDFIHPDDKDHVEKRFQQRLSGKKIPENYEFRVLDQSGLCHWIQINVVLFQWDGKPATLNFIHDVTERKLAEEALQDSERQFRAIILSAQESITMSDDTEKIVLWNKASERIFGYTADEIVGQSYRLLLPSDGSKEILLELKHCFKTGQGPILGKIHEVRALSKKGASFPIEISFSSILLKGRWYIIAIARDISERKKIEHALLHAYQDLEQRVIKRTSELQESEKRYHDLFEFAPIGIGYMDKNGNILDANKYMIQLFGYSSKKDFKKVNNKDLYIDTHERKRISDELQISGKVRNNIVTAKRKDTTSFSALLDIYLINLNSKEIWLSSVRDITELLETKKIATETRDFLEKAINGASEFIIILDNDLKVSMWNKIAEDLTGYYSSEIVGRSIKECLCFDDISPLVDHIKNLREGYPSILGDIVLHPKTTGKRILALSSSIIRDEKKNIIGFLIFGRDITSRSPLHGKLLQGNSYLLLGESNDQAIDLFINLQISGYYGLVFSRGNPLSLKNTMPSVKTKMILFGEHPLQDIQTILSLDDMYTEIQHFVQTFDPSVVLLDRLDYLMTIHTYEDVLKLIYKVNTLISSYHAILLIRMNASLLSQMDLMLLQQEVQMLPIQKPESIKLDITLYDILSFVYKQNKNKQSVTFQKVRRQFSISKVTTQKRIYDLEQLGLISIKITGREKIVYITREGEVFLRKRTAV